MRVVNRTECGWAGFENELSNSCRFRRSTLLEIGSVKIIIHSVGRSVANKGGYTKFSDNGMPYLTMASFADGCGKAISGKNISVPNLGKPVMEVTQLSDLDANDNHEKTVELFIEYLSDEEKLKDFLYRIENKNLLRKEQEELRNRLMKVKMECDDDNLIGF